MSRRPGLGDGWFRKFHSDVYPLDKLVTRDGKVGRPPRFYDDRLGVERPELLRKIKRARVAKVVREEQSSSRLIQKRTNVERRVSDFLKRSLR